MINATEWYRIRYAGWAPFYDVVAWMMEDKRRRSIQVAELAAGERVLLLGAGTGLDLDYMPRNVELTAIDITPAMIARCRKRATRLGLDVDCRVMDGQALEFADGSFDAVFLHFVLAVMPDPARALKEVARVLRPGGRLVILNKFVPDDGEAGMFIRLINPLSRIVATDLTFKLGPVAQHVPELRRVHDEGVGVMGTFRVAMLRRA